MENQEKVLLVDLGGVVIQLNWEKLGQLLMDYYAGPRGILTDVLPLTPIKFIKPLRLAHRYIDEFDLGNITPFEFYLIVIDLLNISRHALSYSVFRKIYGEAVVGLNEPMLEMLGKCSAQKIIASNINDISWTGIQKKFGQRLSDLFDQRVLSYVIHQRKPDIPFWLECSRIADQRMETMVLIDDREVNTNSFKSVGGKAVQYSMLDHRNCEQKIMSALYLPHELEK